MADTKNRLTNEEAELQIRDIAKLGYVDPLPHCWERMAQKGYSIDDVIFLLRRGKIKEPPKYDPDFDNWEWKVEGNVIEGDKATVIVAIVSHRELKCITIRYENS